MWSFFEKLLHKPIENVSFCYMDSNGNMIKTDSYKEFAKYLNSVAEKAKGESGDDDVTDDDATDCAVCDEDCENCDFSDECESFDCLEDEWDDELYEPEEVTVFELPVAGVAALAGVLFGAAALIRAIRK